jgi:hypothetical protein
MIAARIMKYAVGLAVALGVAGCGGDDGGNPPPLTGGTDPVTLSAGSQSTSAATETTGATEPTGGPQTQGETQQDTEDGPTNCDELQCSGPGSCLTGEDGVVYCACDEGYRLDTDESTCIVDETCIQVRFLEDHCRQFVGNRPPAVSLFFGLDFCAGTAVTPEKFDELGISFVINENDTDVGKNPESSITLVPITVENYINVVIDVSESLTKDAEFLPELVDGLQGLVDTVEPQEGEPDVYMAVYVFARGVAEFVPFTRDLDTVRSALEVIRNDPDSVIEIAGGGMGTDLFAATKEGIENTQRIRDLRDAVTWGGVLSTGTVIVITDGKDASNGMLDTQLVDTTVNQTISVGLGLDIDDEQLRAIGRDGNFLAPTGADLADAFDRINTRVEEYPRRSYMLGYCSSTTEGTPTVEVTVQGGALTQVSSAVCQFDADLFSTQAFECNDDTFLNECNAQECGGLTGCGACADDQCCTGGSCAAPTGVDLTKPPSSCAGQVSYCSEGMQACSPDDVCLETALPGVNYGEEPCPPGCDPGYECEDDPATKEADHYCVPGRSLGSACGVPSQCASLNCFYVDEDNPFEGRRCLPEARIYDHCGDEDAVCEDGATCEGSSCEPRRVDLVTCNRDDQCRSAVCIEIEDGNFCNGPAACYWAWDEKVPS